MFVDKRKRFLEIHWCDFYFMCKLFFSPHSQSEREEFETDYKQKYERERVLLCEENNKLSNELENVRIISLYIYHCLFFIHLTHMFTYTKSVFSISSFFTNLLILPTPDKSFLGVFDVVPINLG